jgi:hypothetical protein
MERSHCEEVPGVTKEASERLLSGVKKLKFISLRKEGF